MVDTVLSLRTLNRTTLARQELLARSDEGALAVTEKLVALQAQWPRPPFVTLWSRVAGFQREHLADLLRSRTLVRATLLRGTLHVSSAADYRRLRPLLAPMLAKGMLSVLSERAEGLDTDALVASTRTLLSAGARTFEDIRAHLVANHGGADERAMGHAVRMLLPLVQVPTDGDPWVFPAASAFALADEWLAGDPNSKPVKVLKNGKAKALSPSEEAKTREWLVLRYLASFGPASVADAQTWSGLQGLKASFESLRPKLRSYRDERKRELFDLVDAELVSDDAPAPPRFLPEFDNLLLGHDDRRRVVSDEHRGAVFLPGLRVAPTLIVDGVVAATWSTERKKKTAKLVITPLVRFTKKVRDAIAEEGERLLRFLEEDVATFALRFEEA